jgi:hypothetical protein
MSETTFAKPFAEMDMSPEPKSLEQLEFHIKSGDYFPLLATVMGFLEESIRACENGFLTIVPMEAGLIEDVRKELLHLHQHYKIEPK